MWKNRDFSKGVIPYFPPLFRQYCPGKCVLGYFRSRKCLSRLKKQEVQTVQKFVFFQRGYSIVLVQNWPFFHHFFLGNIGQENVFYDILERKNAFRGYKKISSKSGKIEIFPKGLVHNFPLFWGSIAQENVFYDILDRENVFLG